MQDFFKLTGLDRAWWFCHHVNHLYIYYAYQCEYQDEVQSATWTRGSINLFTCDVTYNGSTNTLLICTDYKGKDKFSNGTFIEYLYQNHIPEDHKVRSEIIWSII